MINKDILRIAMKQSAEEYDRHTILAADHEKLFDFFSGMCYLQYTIRERRIGVRVWRNEESVI